MTRDATRVVVEGISPQVDAGLHPTKAILGDPVIVEADVYADGRDLVAAALHVRGPVGDPTEIAMESLGNDRWSAGVIPDQLGTWEYTVAGWIDRWQSWRRDFAAKVGAGQNVAIDLEIGRGLVEAAAKRASGKQRRQLLDTHDEMTVERAAKLHDVLDLIDDLMRANADRDPMVTYEPWLRLDVDRERAEYGAWYELFPRSWGPGSDHGTLRDVAARLDYVAEMGFDVVYLPPIHPIGRVNRKGRDNALEAEPDDVGSPWAIGSAEGGHTDLHPDLGTIDDLRHLRRRCNELDLELAIDIAFQCAPDHPWVTEHPEWFRHRPDGSIQFAENPPKRYEDIFPIDFECDDHEALWDALAGVVRYWIDQGIRIFRVDNPHTKPFRFWDWLIGDVRAAHPDVIFLAEAFTRPKVMNRLAKGGFDQSYTYFAWRTSPWELRQYFTELNTPPESWFFRPNVWPNTPDILTPQLQHGSRTVHCARAVLAATLSASYGIYGPAFELQERRPRGEVEEYAQNEKYEIRDWDLDRTDSLRPVLTRLNSIRRNHPALHRNRTLAFHDVDNPHLLAYSRCSDDGADRLLCVVNADAETYQGGTIHLRLDELGIGPDQPYDVEDLIGGTRWTWHGAANWVGLGGHEFPAHVFAITQPA